MIVSVHIPKTAGSSFSAVLRSYFGKALYLDYEDRPLHSLKLTGKMRAITSARSSTTIPSGCVHGHFLSVKYSRVHSASFVTWLRDPVARLRSHFDYWHREYHPSTAGRLHRKVVQQRWSFERFALGPELRNLYGFFLWRFPLARFDFVGITEFYNQDLQCFAEKFGIALSENLAPLNVRPDAVPGVDPSLRKAIEQWHAKDVKLYRQALQWRSAGRWGIKSTP